MIKILQRKSNWPELLERRLLKLTHTQFQYGGHDCCKFGSGIVKLLTIEELDLAAKFGTYKTRIGAARILRKAGYKSVEDFAAKITVEHGMIEVLTSQAKRGDIILGPDQEGNKAVGICVGRYAAFAGNGIDYISMVQVLRAWHYG